MRQFIVRMAPLLAALLLGVPPTPLPAQQVGTIQGTVRTSQGSALPGANVRVAGTSRSTVTGAEGAFILSGVPTGRHTVRVRLTGYGAAEQSVDVRAGESTRLGVTLVEEAVALEPLEVTGRRAESYASDYSFAATKIALPVVEIPQSISAVTKEVMRDQQALRIDEVAKNVAGMNTFSTYDDLSVRGFRQWGGRLVNGLRSSSGWYHPALYNVERVEVVKGPASAVFSNVSPGGTVNYVTKRPLAERRGYASVSMGSWETRRAALDLTGPLTTGRSLLGRVNFGYEDAGSFRDQRFDETLFLAPSLTWLPDARTALSAELVYSRNESVLDRGQPSTQSATEPNMPVAFSVSQPGDFLNTTRVLLNLSASRELLPGWSANLAWLRSRHDEDLREHRFRRYVSEEEFTLSFTDRAQGDDADNLSAFVAGKVRTGGLQHHLLVGADAIWSGNTSRDRYLGNVGVFSLTEPRWFRRPVDSYGLDTIPIAEYDSYYRTAGVYVQDMVEWGPARLLLSLRREAYTTDERTSDVEESVRTEAWIPRVGLTYGLTERLNVYGTYAAGFQPAEAWLQSPVYGGPFTEPETSAMFEVGSKAELFGGRLLATTALYQIAKNDIIIWANDPEFQDLYRQRGQERARGAELELTGSLTPALSVSANAAYNRIEVTEDEIAENVGRIKEGAPKWTSGLWARYQTGGALGFGLGYDFVGERNTFQEGFTLPSYFVLNGAVFYDVGDLRLSLNARNLLDETHWTGGYYPGRVYPGAPRNLLVSAGYRF